MLDTKEERKYKQLRKLGQELHLPIPEHFIELEVTDKNGKVIQTLKQRSHSWVRNAYNLLLSQMAGKNLDDAGVFGAGLLSIKDNPTGDIRDGANGACIAHTLGSFESAGTGYRSPATNNAFGIIVGSDATAESFEDYKLLALIAEGITAGKLNYVAMAVPTKAYDIPTKVFTITWIRYFNNNSPGDVLVKEAALACAGCAGPGFTYWLNSRDKLGETITVPATGQLKVTYTIALTYPP